MSKTEKTVSVKLTLEWNIEIEDLSLSEEAWREVYNNGWGGIKRYTDHFDEIAEAVVSKIDIADYLEEIEIEVEEDEDEHKREYAIGETVQMGLMTLVCVEDKICDCTKCCVFKSKDVSCPDMGECSHVNRTDKKDVIFKLKEG